MIEPTKVRTPARRRLLPLLLLSFAFTWNVDAADDSSAAGRSIHHVVVIYQENVSFDHYFGTYPHALNPAGEPAFNPAPETPQIDVFTDELLHHNPNFLNTANGAGAVNPFRLRRSQAATADQDHSYEPEQEAFDGGRMDLFPKSVGHPDGPRVPGEHAGVAGTSGLTMGH